MPPKKQKLTPEQKNLTNKESLFVQEFLIDLDVERAAVAAGFSLTVAQSKAYQWVRNGKKKPHVFAAIQKAFVKKEKRLERSADEVIKRLWKFSDIDEQRYDAKKSQNTKSTELLAKHYGLLIEKKEITGKDGEKLFPALSDQDRAILASINAK